MAVRISLEDGDWWEVKDVVTRGMQKSFRRATLATLPSGNGASAIDLSDPEAASDYARSHMADINLDASEDAYLLQGTIAFKLGTEKLKKDETLTLDRIDLLPDDKVQVVIGRLQKLYGPPDTEEAKAEAESIDADLEGRP